MTLGTRGDVQPFVTLARGLDDAGYDVTVSSSASFSWLAKEQGVRFAPLELDFTELQDSAGATAVMHGDIGAIREALRQVKPLFRRSLTDQRRVVEVTEPEVLVTHPKTLGGRHLAEWRGIPHAGSLVVPGFTTTGAFPPLPLTWTRTPAWLNRLAYKLVPLGMRSFRALVEEWRHEELGLRGETVLWDGGRRMMYGYSPTVVPNPPDWPPTARAVGYWLPDPPDTYQGDSDVVRFIESGESPVYIGFGSSVDEDPRALGDLVAEAVEAAGVRAVVQSDQGLLDIDSTERIHVTGGIPHSWLFPRMACVVHHGGSGTTGEALRSKRPQVVVPFSVDQPFWAKRMHTLGVSPEPLPRTKLTALQLADAIMSASSNESISSSAAELGDRIIDEDGIAAAATHLERLAADG